VAALGSSALPGGEAARALCAQPPPSGAFCWPPPRGPIPPPSPIQALRFIDEAEPPPEEGSGAMPSAVASGKEAASGPEAAATLEPVANSQAL